MSRLNSGDVLNVIIAGVGGQGTLFASRVMAQAALEAGFSVRVAETYGVTQRGGPVYSQVRIGMDLYGPLIPKASSSLILGLEPIETLRRAVDYLAPGASVAINSRPNVPLESTLGLQPSPSFESIRRELLNLGAGVILAVDARAMAEQAGGAASMNVFMLGTLLGFEVFPLDYESVKRAMASVTPSRFLDMNLLSLARGRDHALSELSC